LTKYTAFVYPTALFGTSTSGVVATSDPSRARALLKQARVASRVMRRDFIARDLEIESEWRKDGRQAVG
jgi:hypothetical protein